MVRRAREVEHGLGVLGQIPKGGQRIRRAVLEVLLGEPEGGMRALGGHHGLRGNGKSNGGGSKIAGCEAYAG